MKTFLFILVAAFTLSACGSKTAEYYEQHPEEMKTKILECSKMSSAEVMTDRECTAVSKANMKKQFDMDPPKESPLKGKGKGQGFKKF